MTANSLPEVQPVSETFTFQNVTLYRVGGMFGVSRVDCKTLIINTGQKYAQYNDAIKIAYLKKGSRKSWSGAMLDYRPWLRVVDTKQAIQPEDPMQLKGDGSTATKYTSCDPRWCTDFEDLLDASGVKLLCSIGIGDREGAHLERCLAMEANR